MILCQKVVLIVDMISAGPSENMILSKDLRMRYELCIVRPTDTQHPRLKSIIIALATPFSRVYRQVTYPEAQQRSVLLHLPIAWRSVPFD